MLTKLKGLMTNEADLVLLKKLFFDKLPTDMIRRLLAATGETDVHHGRILHACKACIVCLGDCHSTKEN